MEETGSIHAWIDTAAVAMEVFAIIVIVAGVLIGAIQFASVVLRRGETHPAYEAFKAFTGRTLLLGLEILIAADVVRTVALDPTWENVFVLGILVLIRTFLSWTLVVDIEGRWPWQQEKVQEKVEEKVEADAHLK
jgi:uncharacterized membrane protein